MWQFRFRLTPNAPRGGRLFRRADSLITSKWRIAVEERMPARAHAWAPYPSEGRRRSKLARPRPAARAQPIAKPAIMPAAMR